MFAFGYRENEAASIPVYEDGKFNNNGTIIEVDPTVKILQIRYNTNQTRPVVQASLGPHVEGLCLPHVDPSDASTVIAGSLYRFGRKMNQDEFPAEKFSQFVKNWLPKNLQKLGVDQDCSFYTWIEKTPYTRCRKDELIMKYKLLVSNNPETIIRPEHLFVKSFIKDECYPEYKHARAINSRTDEFKICVGPILQLISDRLFALPWFIKKIPIHQRPDYIYNMIYRPGKKIFTSDYTSFEASFTKMIKYHCEFLLYDYMTSELPEHEDFMNKIKMTGDKNHLDFKRFSMEIEAKRMRDRKSVV